MTPRRRLLRYMMRYRRAFATGFISVVGATSITLAGPWVLKYAIDDLNQGVTAEKVRLYASLLLGLAAVAGSSSVRRAISSTTCATTSSPRCSGSTSATSTCTARAT
jgi:ABC-type multidrug transport system fused ATPase/permease subunit